MELQPNELVSTILEASSFLKNHLDEIAETYPDLVQNMLILINKVDDLLERSADRETADFARLYADAADRADYTAFFNAVDGWLISAHCALNGMTPEEFLNDVTEDASSVAAVPRPEKALPPSAEEIMERCAVPMPAQDKPRIRANIDQWWGRLCDDVRNHSQQQLVGLMKDPLAQFEKALKEDFHRYIDYYNHYGFWGRFDLEKGDYGVYEERAKILKEHLTDFEWLYLHLADYRSKKTLLAILHNWLYLDFKMLSQVKEACFVDYFDPDIISCGRDEVLVDLGAYNGDSASDFVNTYLAYRKIYCYEITPQTMQSMRQNLKDLPNIEFRQKGASDRAGVMYITVDENTSANRLAQSGTTEVETVAIDEDVTEPVTFIKMDIEGAEQRALLGCKRHIFEEHPKLAICTYHNNEDIWKIPRMIHAIDPTYRFYMRYNGGNFIPSEYVLFGV